MQLLRPFLLFVYQLKTVIIHFQSYKTHGTLTAAQ